MRARTFINSIVIALAVVLTGCGGGATRPSIGSTSAANLQHSTAAVQTPTHELIVEKTPAEQILSGESRVTACKLLRDEPAALVGPLQVGPKQEQYVGNTATGCYWGGTDLVLKLTLVRADAYYAPRFNKQGSYHGGACPGLEGWSGTWEKEAFVVCVRDPVRYVVALDNYGSGGAGAISPAQKASLLELMHNVLQRTV
jgi:hypothetical protein